MDFAHIDLGKSAEKGAVLKVKNPITGEQLFYKEKPITIDLVGVESRQGRLAIAQVVLDEQERGKRAKFKSVEEVVSRTLQGQQDKAKLYAAMTTGWYGITYLPKDKRGDEKAVGELLEFSKEAAIKVYTEYPWLQEQVAEFINDNTNFM